MDVAHACRADWCKDLGISLMPILEFLSAANDPDLTRQVDFHWWLGKPAK